MNYSKILAPFSFAEFRITIEAIDPILLQEFKGSAIRGSLGHSFRGLACATRKDDCSLCLLAKQCVYAYFFQTIAPKDDPFLRNKNGVAHPYVIRPPLDKQRVYYPGHELVFELVLIGRAIEYLSYFIQALVMMGERGLGRGRGRFILKKIESLGLASRDLLYQNGDECVRFAAESVTCQDLLERYEKVPSSCTLRFISRLELREKGRTANLTFGALFRNLLRRITTLAYLYNDIECDSIDFGGLSHSADNIGTIKSDFSWENAERFSNRQRQRMPFSGRSGEITFAGEFEPFWPFIVLGERVHAGKKTTFGFGKYIIV